jgi:ER lumen protein retaining receptor
MYNTVMKVLFLLFSLSTVYFMMLANPQRKTYSAEEDSFPVVVLIGPCVILALFLNPYASLAHPLEYAWAFSIYLEALAIIPQLYMLQKLGGCESITGHYVAMLGLYRLLYLINWVCRYMYEPHYHPEYIVWAAGVIQSAIYLDFFGVYLESKKKGMDNAISMPAI